MASHNERDTWLGGLDTIQAQEELMASRTKKRPPLAWDIRTQGPLKMKLAVYLFQKQVLEVIAYDTINNTITYYPLNKNGKPFVDGEEYRTVTVEGSILVCRLD